MTKELYEFTETGSEISDSMSDTLKKFITENPDVVYERINEDEEPELRKQIVNSQAPTAHPCFVAVEDGHLRGYGSGELSDKDLKSLFN